MRPTPDLPQGANLYPHLFPQREVAGKGEVVGAVSIPHRSRKEESPCGMETAPTNGFPSLPNLWVKVSPRGEEWMRLPPDLEETGEGVDEAAGYGSGGKVRNDDNCRKGEHNNERVSAWAASGRGGDRGDCAADAGGAIV
jgi:hypothetical protein